VHKFVWMDVAAGPEKRNLIDRTLGRSIPGAFLADNAATGELTKDKSRFFDSPPRTEKRSGPRSLRMTDSVLL
jgi:hypothetical protein